MRYIIIISVTFFTVFLHGQIVTLSPQSPGPEDAVTLIFDASIGNKELLNASKVYVHHGVVTDKTDGTTWKYVKGNWGKDDGIGQMSKVPGQTNKWQITFSPNIRSYFGVPSWENIYRIACVFRSPDGSKKGTIAPGEYGWGSVTSNNDIYINLSGSNYVSILSPSGTESTINEGETIDIKAEASAIASEIKLWLDEGNGFTNVATISGSKFIQYQFKPTSSLQLKIKVTANINGENLEAIKNHSIIVKRPNIVEPVPIGMKNGINYITGDETKALLVLLAPEKEFVYVVGDMTDWQIKPEYLMKKSPDGKKFWIELKGLTPKKPYVFQYWIDGNIKVADPFADQIADPWNDQYIESSVFPNLPVYSREDFGIASVLTTGQTSYQWSSAESAWKRPDANHLVIYELHIRDFIDSHNFKDLTDTLSYLKRLGVNAIELMPVNEFEGNDSWGYNPSFFFAVDKYYGPKEQLKKFIETAHQHGIAVITDLVLNHAFGQCPLVQMYFDKSANKPALNNPWFNREYVGQYQWGFDFNHQSSYTQDFIDEVNRYWVDEFHFDGFRFDFTKGFTNNAPNGSIDEYDASRISILKRMADKIWDTNPQSYIILEHWAPQSEESELGNYGLKMWRNKSYDYVPAALGNPVGSFSNMDATSHVAFYNSHDERRIAEHCLTEGRSSSGYNIKDTLVMLERVKMAAAFTYLQPGLKMIWQFDELGYDIDINLNGRTGRKPQVWGPNSLNYYYQPERQNVYKTYQNLLKIRHTIGAENLSSASKNHQYSGDTRRLVFNTSGIDLVVIGNFGLSQNSISPEFTQTGKWYNYFSGDSVTITNTSAPINLKAGEWHIFTSKRMSEGMPGVVSVFENPATITPYLFKANQEITIRFDASKASPGTTSGLIGADKVYMHAGVLFGNATSSSLTNVVGNLKDDGVGQMTKVADNIWEIKIIPNQYFTIGPGQEISNIGMWFRNGDNTKKGYGFKNSIIYFSVISSNPIVNITPSGFSPENEITIVFNANEGNRELVGAQKVYMHSGIINVNTSSPESAGWAKVVGNWGKDDGVGLMTKVVGEIDKWQIKLKPRSYYGMATNEFPYWITAVFRDASGSKKGTANPGIMDNGFVANNQDYFIKNTGIVNTKDIINADIMIYPNPTSGNVQFKGLKGNSFLKINDIVGKEVYQTAVSDEAAADLSKLVNGLYFFSLTEGNRVKTGKLIIAH
jgi:1,4-alpha-glucan branching enzyme